jgi:cytochrome c2
LAARLAVLIALAASLAGCVERQAAAPRDCVSCHAPHYVREGSCRDCHRGQPGTGRTEIAHAGLLTGAAAAHRLPESRAVRAGRELVDALACRRCHTIAGEGNTLATNLDRVVWKRQQKELVASITQPVAGMPRFGLGEAQAETLVAFLLRGGDPNRPQDAYRVHFEDEAPATTIFEKSCGGCHRALTSRGPLGAGDAGPNLSGLFSAYHPRTAPVDVAWTPKLLAEWLRNPRAARAQTTMPPVELADDELRQLVAELGGAPQGVK